VTTEPAPADSASAAVLLCDPKFAHNVGNALRACALLGAGRLYWTGDRVPGPEQWPSGTRLPREERLKCSHRFVRIPAADPDERTPFNLAFCVGAVLLDRLTKQTRPWLV